jgi:hypothetical protein
MVQAPRRSLAAGATVAEQHPLLRRDHAKKETEFICSFVSLEAGQAMAI